MQEQNLRLLQQLREKDDANFKLMSERIKSNQIQKLLREEKEVLQVHSGHSSFIFLYTPLFVFNSTLHWSLHSFRSLYFSFVPPLFFSFATPTRIQEQVATIHSQCEAQNVVVRKLEEKERILQNNLLTVEKELALRQQAMELHKRKALESTQVRDWIK